VPQTIKASVSRFGPVIAPAFPGGRYLTGQIIIVNGGTYFNT